MKVSDQQEVREIVAHYLHTHQPSETAPLSRDHVERVLRLMTSEISSKTDFGVTLTQDHNGAWGPLGQRLLTLRFGDGKDHIEVSMIIQSVTSFHADQSHMAFLQEDK